MRFVVCTSAGAVAVPANGFKPTLNTLTPLRLLALAAKGFNIRYHGLTAARILRRTERRGGGGETLEINSLSVRSRVRFSFKLYPTAFAAIAFEVITHLCADALTEIAQCQRVRGVRIQFAILPKHKTLCQARSSLPCNDVADVTHALPYSQYMKCSRKPDLLRKTSHIIQRNERQTSD